MDTNSSHSDTIMMLGASGFLGHFVLRDLLVRRQRIVVVLRAPLAEAADRLCGMMREIGTELAPFIDRRQLLFAEGSLPDALPEPEWGQTNAILHCAACLGLFSNGDGEPFRTNVAGTEAVADWALVHGVGRIYAVSTAYTCGWNTGVIKEEFHHPEPRFQTDYERSKWQAESVLEEWSSWLGNSLTVFRPSFLVGDSVTGYTTQFGGFYQLARLVHVLKSQYADRNNGDQTFIPLRIPGRPNDAQNIIPVDFVSRVIAEVVTNHQFRGRIYHLTHPQPPTNDMMKCCYEDYFGLHGGRFADPDEVVGRCSPAESILWDRYHLLTQRVVQHNPAFDITNTQEVMKATGLSLPVFDRERIFQLFDYAAARGWGRQAHNVHS